MKSLVDNMIVCFVCSLEATARKLKETENRRQRRQKVKDLEENVRKARAARKMETKPEKLKPEAFTEWGRANIIDLHCLMHERFSEI